MRAAMMQVYREFSDGIPFSKRAYGVATRLMELPATASLPEVGMKLFEMLMTIASRYRNKNTFDILQVF